MTAESHEDKMRRELGIPKGAHITFIDMDKNRVEPVITAGWTDDQIKGKTEQELRATITQRETGLVRLTETVDNERGEIEKLKQVLRRKLIIGD